MYIKKLISPNLFSIVNNYLLPNKDEMKKLYSNIIITPTSQYETTYRITSIESQYYYFQFRKRYQLVNIIHENENWKILVFNIGNIFDDLLSSNFPNIRTSLYRMTVYLHVSSKNINLFNLEKYYLLKSK